MMYKPQPIDTTDVVLSEDLLALTEKIAENVHEVWSAGRIQDGWTYGAVRNDEKKQTPCLVPYNELPEREKDFDRNTAMETIKMIIKLGYGIRKDDLLQNAGFDPTPVQLKMVKKISEVYAAFGIKIGPLIDIVPGEKTTRFDFAVDSDTVFPKIRKLRDDVSLFLSVPPVDLTCPIAGKMAFGIEIPNKEVS